MCLLVLSNLLLILIKLKAVLRRVLFWGPLLFLLFINDLPDALPLAKVVLFADDTNILLIENSIGALNGKIKKVIDQLESWFNDNQLLINTDKMKALFFRRKELVSKYRPAFCVCNREVLYSSTAKFLGIEISENFSCKNCIQYLCPRLNKALYLIKSLCKSVSLQVLKIYTLQNLNSF
jgi:hypothetical protein